MIRLNNRFARIILLLLSSTILTFTSFSLLALAQEPSPFEINVKPAADYAVRGQVFTYTVTVTNTSTQLVKSAFVNIDVPAGTEFLGTRYDNPKWYGGAPFSDPAVTMEQITLFTPDVIDPGEVFTFSMFVELLPKTVEQVVVDSYEVGGVGNEIFVTGSSLETQVIEPTPTPSPTRLPSPTPVVLPTLAPSPTVSNVAVAEITTDSSPTPQTEEVRPSVSVQQEVTQRRSLLMITLVTGAIALVVIAITLGWFFRRK